MALIFAQTGNCLTYAGAALLSEDPSKLKDFFDRLNECRRIRDAFRTFQVLNAIPELH